MQISTDQLASHIERGLKPIYLLFGDDPVGLSTAHKRLLEAAKAAGFAERIVKTVEQGSSLEDLLEQSASHSLFASQQLVDVSLINTSLNKAQEAIILSLVENCGDDLLVILRAGELKAQQQRSKWVKAIGSKGQVVRCWAVDEQRMPSWLVQRAQILGLTLSPEAQALILSIAHKDTALVENMLQKLVLVAKDRTIEPNVILALNDVGAGASIYDVADSVLMGNTAKALRQLEALRLSGAEPILLLWCLMQDVRALYRILHSSLPMGNAIQEFVKFRRRQPAFQRAAKRHSKETIATAFDRAFEIDRAIKNMHAQEVWRLLKDFVVGLAQASPTVPMSKVK